MRADPRRSQVARGGVRGELEVDGFGHPRQSALSWLPDGDLPHNGNIVLDLWTDTQEQWDHRIVPSLANVAWHPEPVA